MDPQVQTSFIPKKSLEASAVRGAGVGLFFLLSLLVFITSLLAAGGVFGYQYYLQKTLDTKKHDLDASQGAFEPGTIQQLQQMDKRLTQVKILMDKHVALSPIIDFIGTITLEKVAFNGLNLTVQNDGSAVISMTGRADSFGTVALQSDQFNTSKLLKEVVFSGISADSVGTVGFTVNAKIDPSIFSYRKVLQNDASTQ